MLVTFPYPSSCEHIYPLPSYISCYIHICVYLLHLLCVCVAFPTLPMSYMCIPYVYIILISPCIYFYISPQHFFPMAWERRKEDRFSGQDRQGSGTRQVGGEGRTGQGQGQVGVGGTGQDGERGKGEGLCLLLLQAHSLLLCLLFSSPMWQPPPLCACMHI